MSTAKIVLDTCIVSYLMKGGPLAEAYTPHVQGRLLAISFITVGELYFGAENKNWGEKKRKELETRLRNYVVIPYDNEIARNYGKIVNERQLVGKPIAFNDAWIASCAVRHNVSLVTHDADFMGIGGLKVITENRSFNP